MAGGLVAMSTVTDGHGTPDHGQNGFPRAQGFSRRWRLGIGDGGSSAVVTLVVGSFMVATTMVK